jgi:toxin HigB-1
MDFEFGNADLEDVYYDPKATFGHGPSVDKGFRKVVGLIRSAHDEQDLRNLKGLHYHKLKGSRENQHALNVTDKWRLIVERIRGKGKIKLLIISLEDYH